MLDPKVEKNIEKIRRQNNPSGVSVHAVTQTPVTIEEVVEAVKDLGEHRSHIIKIILAVFVSTFFAAETPIWLMLVGNPSSNKTTLVDLLKGHPDIYRLDSMTSNPFSSGQREKEKPQDLLPRLHGKCFIVKEYGTILSRSDEMVKQLLGDYVAIYDGEFSKHSPTRGTIRYESTFSHIGCVTPMALEGRQRYMSAVGARFLFLKIPPLTDLERGCRLDEMWEKTSKKSKQEVTELVCVFCSQLKAEALKGVEIQIDEVARSFINVLALFIARARGIVITEARNFETEEGGSKTHYEAVDVQIEEPFRAAKQLKKLVQALAIVNGHNEVNSDELDILLTVGLSSMPVRRADILSVFRRRHTFTAKEAANVLDKNYRTVKRNFDELVALKILDGSKGINDMAKVYTLKSEFASLFKISEVETSNTFSTDEKIKGLFGPDTEITTINPSL